MDKTLKIAIIGGGASGLAAAHYLKKKGYEAITVFEAASDLGGKCYSLEVDGLIHEMGAVIISPAYIETLKLAKEFDCELDPAPVIWAIDPETGHNREMPSLDDAKTTGLSDEDIQMIGLTYLSQLRKYKKNIGVPGFVNTPEAICQPFAPWARSLGLEFLVDIFRVPLTCFGYGSLEEVPAAYVMKNMSRKSFLNVTNSSNGWPKIFRHGYQDLMRKMGQKLDDVRLGARVTQVTRGDTVFVEYTQDGNAKSETFDALIVAVPLDDEGSLSFLDLHAEEKALFQQVEYFPYATIAARTPSLPAGTCYAPILKGDGFVEPPTTDPCLYVRNHKESDCAIYYANGKDTDTVEDYEKALVRSMEHLGHPVTEILKTRIWRYFPHVNTEALKAGFFDKLEAMQGSNSTFYTGGQLDFDIVEGAVSYSLAMVNRYFND